MIGCILFHASTVPIGPATPHYWGFTITLRHTTLGMTPLDEWLARHRDLYLTTHNTHKTHSYPLRDSKCNHRKRAAAIPPLRPCGHWYRLIGHKSWFSNRSLGSRLTRLIKRNFNQLHCFNYQNQYIAVNIVCLIIHHFLVPFSAKPSTDELDCDGKRYIRGLEL